MSRQEILAYLGADWDRTLALIRSSLHTDVGLLEDTNGRILSNSGKLLRPMVALLLCRAIGSVSDDSISYAAASEMLHNATLMHDDVADESMERRGRPTLSALLGPGAAVLVGDYWLARAVDLVVRTGHRDTAIPLFARTLTDLAEGEMLQMEKASSCDTTEEDYLRIIHCKTGSLFCVAAETAALSVDASAEHRAAALTFANALGNAFQIKDDILDYAGTDSLGKPVGVDLREQKITLPLLGALEGSPRESEIRQMVREIPSRPEYCDRIRAFVAERGGISYAVRRLGEWVEQAVCALDAFADSPARTYLTDIARFNLWREV
ncbi:MAG: polyprenyl synthetase family protein [Bacteroidales bacterium]|nr:polyprenyl synthetase family protein [Bacteroidales bacterium]